MKAVEFCYWLQGFFELTDVHTPKSKEKGLTATQTDMVRKHLAMVFKHEIDPSYEDTGDLDEIHSGTSHLTGSDPSIRC